jgi:hypothetical protein
VKIHVHLFLAHYFMLNMIFAGNLNHLVLNIGIEYHEIETTVKSIHYFES